MTSAADMLSGRDFMPQAGRIRRLRARGKVNPYNPAREVADWTDADGVDSVELDGFVASSSSVEVADAARSEMSSTAYLTVPDPEADVLPGDRVERVPFDGHRWRVTGLPSRDASPFTGWSPTLEATLEEVLG